MLKSMAEKELYLRGYEELLDRIQEIKDEIKECRISMSNAKAQQYSDMPSGSGKKSDLSDYSTKLETLEKEKRKVEKIAANRKRRIRKACDKLHDETEKMVIAMRYLDLMPWNEIAKMLGKSKRQTHRYNTRAIGNIRL